MNRNSFYRRAGRAAYLMLALLMFTCALPALAGAEGANETKQEGGPSRPTLPIDLNPTDDHDFSTIRIMITISKESTVTEIKLKLLGEYYFTNVMNCISDTSDSEYTLKIKQIGSSVYAYDNTGALITSGAKLRLNRVYVSHTAGYATLFTTGCASTSYPYGTNGNHYQGDLEFDVDADGKLRMINIVPMKYYEYGVIEHEISYLCYPAALQAHAVAAKCFGMSYMYQKADYDLGDGYVGNSQMYRGYQLDAGKMTLLPHCDYVLGKAISYTGKIIPTYYGATNGGETTIPSIAFNSVDAGYDSAYDIWIDNADFAIATSPSYRSTIELTYGPQSLTSGDYVSRFKDFVLAKAREIYGGEYNRVVSISSLLAFDPLPRTQRNMRQVSFSAVVTDTNAETPVQQAVTCAFPSKELKEKTIQDYDGSGDVYTSSKPGVFDSNKLKYWGAATSNGYNLYYIGRGHALGLSQKGAEAMAMPEYGGHTYEEILAFYYPHFDLVDIREDDPDAPLACTLKASAYGHCTGANVNVRTTPASNGNTILGIAHSEDHLDVVSVTDDGQWYLVLWNGHMGYMNYKYVKIDMFPSPADAVFTLWSAVGKPGAELRTAPTEYANAAANVSGKTMTIWASVGNWYYAVTDNGHAGYIKKSDVALGSSWEHSGAEGIPNAAPNPQYLSSADERPVRPRPVGRIEH